MFAYCGNNPTNYCDPHGYKPRGFWSFNSDEVGREILWHYLYGNGEDFPVEEKHRTYLKKHTGLKSEIRNVMLLMAEQVPPGQSAVVDTSISVEIDNGEDIVGYQYLHGTNANVGGFQIKGEIIRLYNGDMIFNMTYTWNDIMDPELSYDSDKAKANLAKWIPFANPTDYCISISWHDVSFIPANGDSSGGIGWLGS